MSLITFLQPVTEHLAEQLGVKVEDINRALETYGKSSSPKAKTKSRKSPKPKSPKSSSSPTTVSRRKTSKPVVLKCSRIPNGKQSCTRNAKVENWRMRDGEKIYFCGTAKSSCWAAILRREQKEHASGVSKIPPLPKGKGTSSTRLSPRKRGADAKSKSLIKKSSRPTTDLSMTSIKIDGKELFYLRNKRIMFEEGSQIAYGILGKNNRDILPLTDSAKNWLEMCNCKFREEASAAASASACATSSDDSGDDDLEDSSDASVGLSDDDDEDEGFSSGSDLESE